MKTKRTNKNKESKTSVRVALLLAAVAIVVMAVTDCAPTGNSQWKVKSTDPEFATEDFANVDQDIIYILQHRHWFTGYDQYEQDASQTTVDGRSKK